jgi:hypothetical protein
MNYHFEVQWRESKADKWEPQQGGFNSRRDANDWIVDQPDGGMYRVVIEERETPIGTMRKRALAELGIDTLQGCRESDRIAEGLDAMGQATDESDTEDCDIALAAISERGTPTGETIDITPVGCQTPEGNERVNRAMRVCDMTTVTVAELATQMVETLEANQSYASAKFDAIKAAIKARKDAYENLLKTVSGR